MDRAPRLLALLVLGLSFSAWFAPASSAAGLAVFICEKQISSAAASFARDGNIWTPADAAGAAVGQRLAPSGQSYLVASAAVPRLTEAGIDYVSLNSLAAALGAQFTATATQVKVRARVTDVRFTGGVLKISANLPVRYSVRSLKNPDRIYIDVVGARLEGSPAETKSQTSVVRALRIAQFNEDTVRVTAQLSGTVPFKTLSPSTSKDIAVQIGSPSGTTAAVPKPNPAPTVSAPPEAQPKPEIVVAPAELESVSLTGNNTAVRLTLAADSPLEPRFGMHIDSGDYWLRLPNTKLAGAPPKVDTSGSLLRSVEVVQDDSTAQPSVTIKVAADRVLISRVTSAMTPGQMYWTLALPTLSDGNWRGKLIVIDAGHGGTDTGAQGNGLVEKSLNLAVARLVRDEAIKRDLNIVMTREGDQTMSLRSRTDLIASSDAHLFVSIHHNSSAKRNSASGSEVYYHLQDPESRALAEIVIEKMTGATGLANRGARSDSKLYKTGLFVLRNSPTPAILVEVGYVNSTSDAAKLKDTNMQRKAAVAIVDAIIAYLGKPLESASRASDAGWQPAFWDNWTDSEPVPDQTYYAGDLN